MNFQETIKAYLTVSEVIDRCLLNGIEGSQLPANEVLQAISVNNVSMPTDVLGSCTIGFLKSQLNRKKQLAELLEKYIQQPANEVRISSVIRGELCEKICAHCGKKLDVSITR